jgi:hypothetical protein
MNKFTAPPSLQVDTPTTKWPLTLISAMQLLLEATIPSRKFSMPRIWRFPSEAGEEKSPWECPLAQSVRPL